MDVIDYIYECDKHINELSNYTKQLRNQYNLFMAKKSSIKATPNQISHKQQSSTTSFFVGCLNIEQLENRYKQLAKAFHPDTSFGDAESMKIINNEYEKLRAKLKK